MQAGAPETTRASTCTYARLTIQGCIRKTSRSRDSKIAVKASDRRRSFSRHEMDVARQIQGTRAEAARVGGACMPYT